MGEDEVSRLRSENHELRRLLNKHQWSGLTPPGATGACPECAASEATGHRPDCAIARILKESALT